MLKSILNNILRFPCFLKMFVYNTVILDIRQALNLKMVEAAGVEPASLMHTTSSIIHKFS